MGAWEAWLLVWALACMSVSFGAAEVKVAKGSSDHWFPRISGILFALLSVFLIMRLIP